MLLPKQMKTNVSLVKMAVNISVRIQKVDTNVIVVQDSVYTTMENHAYVSRTVIMFHLFSTFFPIDLI